MSRTKGAIGERFRRVYNEKRIKQDCFAKCGEGCVALNEPYCAYEECNFYKPKSEVKEEE